MFETFDIPKNQTAKHPDSVCLGISGVVIGSALSKGSRSGPEAFRTGHFEDSKPETAHEKPLVPRVAIAFIGLKMLTIIIADPLCLYTNLPTRG